MTVQERILQAATRRFVREGVFASRLEDICRDADASVGAVYHHFRDKQALHGEAFLAALADYQKGFVEALQASEDAESGVKGAVRYHLQWVAANRDAAALLIGERPSGRGSYGRLAEQNGAFFKAVLRWWRVHVGYGALRELDPALLHALWLGPAHDFCGQWLAGRNRKLPSAELEHLADSDRGPALRERTLRAVADELAHAAWTTLRGGSG